MDMQTLAPAPRGAGEAPAAVRLFTPYRVRGITAQIELGANADFALWPRSYRMWLARRAGATPSKDSGT